MGGFTRPKARMIGGFSLKTSAIYDKTRVCHLKRKKGAEGGSFFAVKQGKSFKNK